MNIGYGLCNYIAMTIVSINAKHHSEKQHTSNIQKFVIR